MIKKILSILLFVAITVTGFSQMTYSTDSAYVQMTPGTVQTCEIYLTNSGNHDVMLSWRMINSTLKDFGNADGAWTLGYCDCVQCYNNDFAELIKKDTCPNPLGPGETTHWYITVDPGTVAMTNAEWIVEVNNMTDGVLDTISYFLLDHPNSVNKINYSANVKNYPNPANTEMVIDYALTDVNSPVLSLYNIVGSKVATYSLNSQNGRFNLNTSNLENGMYFYTIEEQGQSIFIQKFNVLH